MVMESICFSEPSGLIENFITDEYLGFDVFAEAWLQQQILHTLQPIARKYLNIEDLEQHPDLRNALVESPRAGHTVNKRTLPCSDGYFQGLFKHVTAELCPKARFHLHQHRDIHRFKHG